MWHYVSVQSYIFNPSNLKLRWCPIVSTADRFPNGPVNLRIFAESREGKKDIYELKLFNLGAS